MSPTLAGRFLPTEPSGKSISSYKDNSQIGVDSTLKTSLYLNCLWKDLVSKYGHILRGFPCGLVRKESPCNAGDLGSIPGLERSPGEGKGYPLQYSGVENADRLMGSQRVGHD